MRLLLFCVVTLATATALYIPIEKEEAHKVSRDVTEDELYQERDLEDIRKKYDEVLRELEHVLDSKSKRGLTDVLGNAETLWKVYNGLKKAQQVYTVYKTAKTLYDVATGVKGMVNKIQGYFGSSSKRDLADVPRYLEALLAEVVMDIKGALMKITSTKTRDVPSVKRDLVDAATKIEAILNEIKKFFKPEEKRGAIVDAAQKIQDLIAKLKGILSGDSDDESTEDKRDLVDVATKVEETASRIQDLIAKIKDILSGDNTDEEVKRFLGENNGGVIIEKIPFKRDLVDAATKIESILAEIKKFFKPEEKRGAIVDAAQKIQDLIAKIKGILSGDNLEESAEKRDLVDAATKIEAILAEIKKFFKPEEKRGAIVDAAQKIQDLIAKIKGILSGDNVEESAEKRDLVDAATKIEAILAEIKKFFKPEEKRGAIVDAAQKIQDLIAKLKGILAGDSDDEHTEEKRNGNAVG